MNTLSALLLACALVACASAPSAGSAILPERDAPKVGPASTASAPTDEVAESAAPLAAAEPAAEPEITCEQLIDHMMSMGNGKVHTQELSDGKVISEGERDMTDEEVEEMKEVRDHRVKRCHESPKFPQDVARCIMKASKKEEAEACVPKH
jgi:hypothetical protein